MLVVLVCGATLSVKATIRAGRITYLGPGTNQIVGSCYRTPGRNTVNTVRQSPNVRKGTKARTSTDLWEVGADGVAQEPTKIPEQPELLPCRRYGHLVPVGMHTEPDADRAAAFTSYADYTALVQVLCALLLARVSPHDIVLRGTLAFWRISLWSAASYLRRVRTGVR